MRHVTICLPRFVFFSILCVLMLSSSSALADIYKWTVNGKTHYSDRPQIGRHKTKTLKLDKLSTHKAVIVNPGSTYLPPNLVKPKVSNTYSLSIQKPTKEQTFTDILGNVSLEFLMTPGLNSGAGHVIRYRMDKQTFTDVAELAIELTNIDRGSHTIFAKVVDNQGIALSPEVSTIFYVQRPSALILQNLKNSGAIAPNLSPVKPMKGISAPPANPK